MITVEKDAGRVSREPCRGRAPKVSARRGSVLRRAVPIRGRLRKDRGLRDSIRKVSAHSRAVLRDSVLRRADHKADVPRADARRASVRGTDGFR